MNLEPSQTRQVVVPADLARRIDSARGDVPFSTWMKRAAEDRLHSAYSFVIGVGAPVPPD